MFLLFCVLLALPLNIVKARVLFTDIVNPVNTTDELYELMDFCGQYDPDDHEPDVKRALSSHPTTEKVIYSYTLGLSLSLSLILSQSLSQLTEQVIELVNLICNHF